MTMNPLSTGQHVLDKDDQFRMLPLQHHGIFSYQTIHGEKWGVRFNFQRQRQSWRGFADKTSAQAFRDDLWRKRKAGQLFPEKYSLILGGELLTTTIDYYLSIIESEPSARDQRGYGAFWKTLFPCATANSLTVNILEKARQTIPQKFPAYSPATVNRHVVWLAHVINHAITRGIAMSNPVVDLYISSNPVKIILCRPGQ